VPNSHNLKNQDGSGCQYSELGVDLCTKVGGQMRHGHAEMTRDQKSKLEVNLHGVIKRMLGT